MSQQYRKTLYKKILIIGFLCHYPLAIIHAAPGELADRPLNLVKATPPNIMLLLDDSGSMNNQQVITNEAQTAHAVGIDGAEFTDENRSTISSDIQFYQLCAGVNTLAYNPKIQYEPWESTTAYTFENQEAGSALIDPLGEFTKDLRNDIYVRWDDLDEDGIYDYSALECGPGIVAYDATVASTFTMPTTNTEPELGLGSQGILTDSNASDNGNDYSAGESGTFTINVANQGADEGTLTLTITEFNLDDADNNQSTSTRDNADRLEVHTGLTAAGTNPDFMSITTENGSNVTGFVGYYPDARDRSLQSPYVLYHHTANDTSGSIYTRVRTLKIAGSEAHLRFFSDDNGFERDGFILSWSHSSGNGEAGDGVVTKMDCNKEHCVSVDSLSDTSQSNDPTLPYNTQQNYANWFTYYRTKDYVAKKAVSKIIKDSQYRMGLATINDRGNGGAIIRDLSELNGNEADREHLLNQLYQANTISAKDYDGDGDTEDNGESGAAFDGTALRSLLDKAGKYFLEETPLDNEDTLRNELFFGTNRTGSTVVAYTHKEVDDNNNTLTLPNSPILADGGQCQQNFSLLFTDGAWNGDTPSGVDNMDADTASKYDGGAYADSAFDTLADVAMKYFKGDDVANELRLELHGQTISHRHMVTFGIAFGVNGSLTSDPVFTLPADDANTFPWPDPTIAGATAADRIDDLRHAAYNGRGRFYSASNVETLQQGLDDIITEIGIRVANTAAGASLSSFELTDGESRFDVTYNTHRWWGELESFPFINGSFSTVAEWSADTKMTARATESTRAGDRQIITYNGHEGIQFAFPASYKNLETVTDEGAGKAATLSQTQIVDLLADAPHEYTTTTDVEITKNNIYGKILVDYLRGNSIYRDGTQDIALDGARLDGLTIEGVTFEHNDGGDDEPALFRDRGKHYIGSLIHSQPQYVGAPREYYPNEIETTSYSSFASDPTHKYRRAMIYVGGNDGMLHGFYAHNTYQTFDDSDPSNVIVTDHTDNNGGKEVFAYIPGLVSQTDQGGNGLNSIAISRGNHLDSPPPSVDGSPVTGDVFVTKKGDSGGARWRTYLVGGLRAGGKGIYVLDVTNPDDAGIGNPHPNLSNAEEEADDIVVLEFTHDNLGHVYGHPKIAKMNNGRWAAIVGNGYNSFPQGDGRASLFIVYLDDVTDDARYTEIPASNKASTINCAINTECSVGNTETYVYAVYEHTTTPGTTDTPNSQVSQVRSSEFICNEDTFGAAPENYELVGCVIGDDWNGLSEPAIVDLDGDGDIDRVYAGDLHGNMWVFDLSDDGDTLTTDIDSDNDWKVHDNSESNNDPLFIACSTSLVDGRCPVARRQPITSRPIVALHPLKSEHATAPNTVVFFGTGQYLTKKDIGDLADSDHLDSFYGIWDAGKLYRSLSQSNLQQQNIVPNPDDPTNEDQRTIDGQTVDYITSTSKFGWYLDLPISKERSILSPVLFRRVLVFVTLIPNEELCNTTAGDSFLMAVDPLTGGALSFDVFGTGRTGNGFISGVKYSSAIVGINVTRDQDDSDIRIREAGANEHSVTIGGEGHHTDESGNGILSRGRKSWSILR
ncbi:hypothetical protein AB835_01020 [Candidatus Endobugula sertula]|uniref:PilY1 beta-propeller domain-containing protein n=1 Tax=Candidatus Endobugula sertula TaxID=62101 RepID=A0A1D2QTH8_9GAMM|nr:hypothetical protein AB835_01020 [Candidatus Endobugula sertula]